MRAPIQYNMVVYFLFTGEQLFLLINTDQTEGATVSKVTVLGSDGSSTSTNTTAAGKGYFYATINAPASFFQIGITGIDSRGYQFSRISHVGVDTTDVQIALGVLLDPNTIVTVYSILILRPIGLSIKN